MTKVEAQRARAKIIAEVRASGRCAGQSDKTIWSSVVRLAREARPQLGAAGINDVLRDAETCSG